MAPNLTPGVFKIVSLTERNPLLSVNLTLPGFQPVYLNGPVTTWVIRPEGDATYRLSVGGYPFTGVMDGKVTASIHAQQDMEWIMIYRKNQDAYTISPMNDTNRGWTISDNDDPHSKVEIELLITLPVEPPKFAVTQLFRFEPLE